MGLGVAPSFAQEGSSPQLVDRVVAVVDQEPILLSDLEREIESFHFEAQAAGQPVDDDAATVRTRMLDRLVEIKLLVAQAKVDGMEISDEELERAVANDLDQLIARYGTRAALEAELAQIGMSFADLQARHRELNRNRIYTARIVRNHIHPKIEIMDHQVRAFYEENVGAVPAAPDTVRLSNVLVVPQYSEQTRAEVETWLTTVQAALAGGTDFEEAARQYSEGPNAPRGGLIGEDFARGDLFSPVLEDVAWRLELGQVSRPVQTELGVHLIRVTARDEEKLTLYQIMKRVALTDADRAAARDLAARVSALAREGSDFGQLAGQYSDDPATASSGGDLGFFPMDRLSPQFVDVVTGMQVGDVSDPLSGAAGYFVLKLTEKVPGKAIQYQDVKDRLRDVLFERRIEAEMQTFLQGLREKFYIELKT